VQQVTRDRRACRLTDTSPSHSASRAHGPPLRTQIRQQQRAVNRPTDDVSSRLRPFPELVPSCPN
jgi:hypothetical protein